MRELKFFNTYFRTFYNKSVAIPGCLLKNLPDRKWLFASFPKELRYIEIRERGNGLELELIDGRMVFPEKVIGHLGLREHDDVVLLGIADYFEIWPLNYWLLEEQRNSELFRRKKEPFNYY